MNIPLFQRLKAAIKRLLHALLEQWKSVRGSMEVENKIPFIHNILFIKMKRSRNTSLDGTSEPYTKYKKYSQIKMPSDLREFKRNAMRKRFGALLFDDPCPEIFGLQIKVARTLLSFVGGEYVPFRLLTELERYDAMHAVHRFLSEMMGFDYKTLTVNPKERTLLDEYLGILCDADIQLKDTGVDDSPLYRALRKRDTQLAERLIDKLNALSPLIQELRESKIVFGGEFAIFMEQVETCLRDWVSFDQTKMNEMKEVYDEWRGLQQQFDAVIADIDAKLAWIYAHFPPDELNAVNTVLVTQIDQIKQDIISGAENVIDGIEALKRKLENLADLIAEFETTGYKYEEADQVYEDDRVYEDWEWNAKADKDEKFTRAYCIFEFDTPYPNFKPDLSFLKKAFRKLAIKYHPDHNPGDKEAEERFKSLYQAKEFLYGEFKYA